MIVQCIVCDQTFDDSKAASHVETGPAENPEDRYYFCGDHCRDLFYEDPDVYLNDQEADLREIA